MFTRLCSYTFKILGDHYAVSNLYNVFSSVIGHNILDNLYCFFFRDAIDLAVQYKDNPTDIGNQPYIDKVPDRFTTRLRDSITWPLNPLTYGGGGCTVYAPPFLWIFCSFLKISLGKPCMKIRNLSKHFVANTPMKKFKNFKHLLRAL